MYWGFSEALDLLHEYEKHGNGPSVDTIKEINILLYGSGDARHILRTLSKSLVCNRTIKINFFVIEGCLEIIARQMLLLNIALEPSTEFSLQNKTHTFMDVYGNSMLRPSSNSYICSKADVYLRAITDLSGYAQQYLPIFKFDRLKYSERDALENIFTFWKNNRNHVYNIGKYWEGRVRSDLGSRYDSRYGLFDWDLSMKLHYYGAQQICTQEYKHWRDVGIGFTFPEYEYCCPNKTLAVAIQRNGEIFQHRGYLGDTTVGPFGTFGLQCSDSAMHKSFHGTNQYRATDITERNLFEIMYEIQEKQPYEHHPTDSREFGGTQLVLSKVVPIIDAELQSTNDLKDYDKPIISPNNITITFLSAEDVLKIQNKPEFCKFFDVVFIAQNYMPFVKQNFNNIFKPHAMVIFETKQLSTLRKEQITEFLMKIKELAKTLELQTVTNFNINLPIHIVRCTNAA